MAFLRASRFPGLIVLNWFPMPTAPIRLTFTPGAAQRHEQRRRKRPQRGERRERPRERSGVELAKAIALDDELRADGGPVRRGRARDAAAEPVLIRGRERERRRRVEH